MTTYEEAISRAMKAASESCKASANKTKYRHTQYGPNGPDDPIERAFAKDMVDGFVENANPDTPANATDVGSPVLTHEKGAGL